MKMLKTVSISPGVIFLLLMLLGSSSPLFSANNFIENSAIQEDSVEFWSDSLEDEQLNILNDSILPFQNNPVFVYGFSGLYGEYDALLKIHSIASLSYVISCRSIVPGLGIRELIYPFHVFL
ncbi:hypothetical protein SAMN06296241_1430 [Salinimicrobium sediminis]|uniref:Uncharacterized protein n=1 Tax=Salinimicrobium sediminis TaxID=1343891 RepID=A0A285X3E3_9FLAO|nr:hypothetical protein [Salinimicrobium sediminis]SOC79890.1 hypothetical protein SAMN06296241_1430 [Salinimicrobium sediminis]